MTDTTTSHPRGILCTLCKNCWRSAALSTPQRLRLLLLIIAVVSYMIIHSMIDSFFPIGPTGMPVDR